MRWSFSRRMLLTVHCKAYLLLGEKSKATPMYLSPFIFTGSKSASPKSFTFTTRKEDTLKPTCLPLRLTKIFDNLWKYHGRMKRTQELGRIRDYNGKKKKLCPVIQLKSANSSIAIITTIYRHPTQKSQTTGLQKSENAIATHQSKRITHSKSQILLASGTKRLGNRRQARLSLVWEVSQLTQQPFQTDKEKCALATHAQAAWNDQNIFYFILF